MSNRKKMQRDAAKALYRKFCKQWKEVAAKQNALDPQGNRHRISEKRRQRYAERGEPILGKRPTFKEWWAAVRNVRQAEDATPEQVQEHIEDLSWDDE